MLRPFLSHLPKPTHLNHSNLTQLRKMTSHTGKSYAEAIEALNTLQSNAATIAAIRASGTTGGSLAPELEYLDRLGYKPSDLNALNVLHITGTKGKGSTSAFCSSLLRSLAPGARVGLYTSPHMIAVRERIRIDGQPIEEELFARYFWQVWERLEKADKSKWLDLPEKPAYFRFLTLLAFHVFLHEKVDATILEVGVGGTYDSTNIVPKPVVTGVTALGIDHVFVLGKTIPEIAAQKGGIYKDGVPALAIEQPAEGLDVLRARARELKSSSFTPIPEHALLSSIPLGLAGKHQIQNASLALALIRTFLASPRLPAAFKPAALALEEGSAELVSPHSVDFKEEEGLRRTRWPGRCQTTKEAESDLTWFLDGAHTVESVACCGEWFKSAALSSKLAVDGQPPKRALIFNCTAGRSGESLLGTLVAALGREQPFDKVIFCSNTTYKDGHSKGDLVSALTEDTLDIQNEIADGFRAVLANLPSGAKTPEIHVLGSIQDAVELVRGLEGEKEVLVTGSLILVGGLMEVASLPLEI